MAELSPADKAALQSEGVVKAMSGIKQEIENRSKEGYSMLRVEREVDNRVIRILKHEGFKVNHERFHHTKDETLVNFISW